MRRVAAFCLLTAYVIGCLFLPLSLTACGEPPAGKREPPPQTAPSFDVTPFDITAFEATLSGPDAKARTVALDELLQAPEPPPATIPTLARALSDENRWVRDRAARALALFGPAAAPAVPALIGALRDPDGFVRWRAAKALAAMGPAAAPAAEELERMAGASDETELGRHWSSEALENLQSD